MDWDTHMRDMALHYAAMRLNPGGKDQAKLRMEQLVATGFYADLPALETVEYRRLQRDREAALPAREPSAEPQERAALDKHGKRKGQRAG